MTLRNWLFTGFAILAAALILVFTLRGPGRKTDHSINPAFSGYISAFTSGLVSSGSSIKVRLVHEFIEADAIGNEAPEGVFSFSPRIKGKAIWKDTRTLEFIPDSPLEQGQEYSGVFHLGEIISLPDSLREFQFQFAIIRQDMSVQVTKLSNYSIEDIRWKYLEGTLQTADDITPETVGKLLKVSVGNEAMDIRWQSSGNRIYTFTVDSIERSEKDQTILITWDGKAIGTEAKGSEELELPSLSNFKVTEIRVLHYPQQYIQLEFSDPLMPSQELRGLISIDNEYLSFTIDKNIVKIFPSSVLNGERKLIVHPGIRNILDKKLKKQSVHTVLFEELKPNIRQVGEGVILPSSNGLVFPFEAVNLRAVSLKIIRIYESNIPQFLQVNDLDESSELYRVGKVITRRIIPLNPTGQVRLEQWNRFTFDISEYIKAEPGAIYRVSVSFRKSDAIYPCLDNTEELQDLEEESFDEEEYDSYSYYRDYWDEGDGYRWNYRWSERDDPCKDSYYYEKGFSRNILASDIGILAKRGNDGSMLFLVTDLLSSAPVSGATLEIFDYQQKLISKLSTGNDGIATMKAEKKPFLVVASRNKNKTYLTLHDGKALSQSVFDVGGASVNNGLKGYIYGERGVWRPGDTLFISFILEDRDDIIPADFPVTAELRDARGKLNQRMVSKDGVEGMYSFRFVTESTDPTGSWNVSIKVGGNTFSKLLKIETVKPNRLKIKLDIPGKGIMLASPTPISLQADWLHGAPGKDLLADVMVTLRPDNSVFNDKYKGFTFTSPASSFYSDPVRIAEGRTDENGKFSFTPDISVNNAPGVLRALMTTKVYEKGGGFSINMSTAKVFPYATYAGLKLPETKGWRTSLETGKEHNLEIINIDPNGKLLSNARLKIEVYKMDWYWWWDRSSNRLSNFLSRPGTEPYSSKDLTLKGGKLNYKLKIPNADWGNFIILVTDVNSGHQTGEVVYFNWPYGGAEMKKEGANLLSFDTDKESYLTGEDILVTIPSSEGGHAFITVENGTRILKHEMIPTSKGKTTYTFKAESGMAPNVYVYVTLIQPHKQSVNDLPIRLYGVVPVNIEDPVTKLSPVIKMADEVRPERTAKLTVSEEKGKPMAYTLAIVDEGLLDLTNFKTPDPWGHFYAKEALGVSTWDIFDHVIGALGGTFEKTYSIGGGDEGDDEGGKNKNANRFKPVVIFKGPYYLKAGASMTHTVQIPRYIGAVRVMVVAAKDRAYGNADKSVKVNNPLMVMGSLPRVAGPEEEIFLPVTVFAMKAGIKDVSIKISTNSFFKVAGNTTVQTSFSKPGEQVINFKLLTAAKAGIGKVMITASSGSEKSTYEVEMDVRNPNPYVTSFLPEVLEPGQEWTTKLQVIGMDGSNSGRLEVSTLPPLNLETRLQYLIRYPHGCVEQVTSAAFPQLFLSNLTELSPEDKELVERNISSAIRRLSAYQHSSGGFSYWPGNRYVSDWGSTYAAHFLLEAKAKGYSVPEGLISAWVNYEKRAARNWNSNRERYYNSDLVQAYRLFTLALAGEAMLGPMNRLREDPRLSTAARWRLAAAYALVNRNGVALELIKGQTIDIPEYRELSYSFGSSTRDRAMILETLLLLGEKTQAARVLEGIASDIGSDRWYSTQTTAYALISVSKFAGKYGTGKGIQASWSYGGGKTKSISTMQALAREDISPKGEMKNGTFTLKNTGNSILYVRLITEGQPLAGQETAEASNLYMKVSYTDLENRPISVNSLEQGTDFYAIVTLRHPGILEFYKELALTQIFPSGWEIYNARLADEQSGQEYFDYQDIRDDRVYTYFSLKPTGEKTYRILLNASYQGKFYLPGIACEAMYDKSIGARVTGKWVEVTAPSR